MSARYRTGTATILLVAAVGVSRAAGAPPEASSPSSGVRRETPLEEALRRYPSTETNAAALDVERLAAAIGIDLVPKTPKNMDRPRTRQETAFATHKESIQKWLSGELTRVSGAISSPPREVSTLLARKRGALAAIRRGILRGEPPVWGKHLERGFTDVMPNVLGHIDLQRLLLADALEQHRRGKHDKAFEDLEASWRLNDCLARSPELGQRMFAFTVTRWEGGVLRRVDRPSRTWRERLGRYRPVVDALETVRLEAALRPEVFLEAVPKIDDPDPLDDPSGTSDLWKCVETESRATIAAIDAIAASGALCDEAPTIDTPPPSPACKDTLFLIDDHRLSEDFLRRASRLALDVEMTRKILELREARDAGGGHWPDKLAGLRASEVCPKDAWTYDVAEDGTMSLAFSRELDWGETGGVVLPVQYVDRPERGAGPAERTTNSPESPSHP